MSRNSNIINRYGTAVLIAAATAILRVAITPVIGGTSYITFYLGIVVAAAIGGIGPGLLVTGVGALTGVLVTVLPASGWVFSASDYLRLGLFLLSGTGISLIAEAMHVHRHRARCQAEANEKNLAQLEAVVQSLEEGLVISDLQGNIRMMNPAAVRLHGFADQEEGRRHFSHYTELFEVTDLKGSPLPPEAWPIARALRGETFSGQEIRVRRRATDKQIITSISGTPVRDRDGKVILAIVTVRDVTEQKRAAEALRESAEHARRIIDNTVAFIGVMTPDGTLVEANATALRAGGLRREEVVGKKFWDCYWWSYDAGVQDQLREAVAKAAGGQEARFDVVVRMAQDSRMPIDFMLAPVRNRAGEITYLIPSGMDITERKQAEEQLRDAKAAAEDASRAKSEFLARMSHEIRTPMTVILGALDHLLETGASTEQRPLVDMATIAARRLLGIINDVLDISKIEAREVKIESIPFNVRECVRQAVGIFDLAAREKGLVLHWEVAPQVPPQVDGDPDRIGQILVNLLGNAVKFTERGEVAVSVAAENGNLVFMVRDTGIGIPRDKLEAIFEPFNQGDSARSRRFGGTGLGLAICRELIDLMGGTIRAETEESRGSTFIFSLPLRPVLATPARPFAEALYFPDRQVRVLLAEDEPAVREMVLNNLRRRGWVVAIAENGRQAVERWEEGDIDVVLMDIRMPEMDGLAATRKIRDREREHEKRACIIALTAHVRPEDREECLAAGMDGFLTKPMRMGDLESTIALCLQ